MPSIINATLVGELVDAGDADGLKIPATALYIFIGIIIGDVRHANDDAVGHAVMAQEPLQVIERALVVLPCVTTVDVRVDVLDVDVVFMDVRQQALDVMALDIKGGLDGEVPLGRCDAAKGVDELAADGRFSTAKGDTPTRGQEIEVVYHHLAK